MWLLRCDLVDNVSDEQCGLPSEHSSREAERERAHGLDSEAVLIDEPNHNKNPPFGDIQTIARIP